MVMQSIVRRFVSPKLLNLRFLFAAPLAYAPGHFYSPICDQAELRRRYRDPDTTSVSPTIPGVDLAHDAQVALWESCFRNSFAAIHALFAGSSAIRYDRQSHSFGLGDATVYASMLLHLRPSRLIEVGVGSSSAVALDVFDRFFDKKPHVSLIDPYPDILDSIVRPSDRDRVEIVPSPIQDVELDRFVSLGRDDILFIDSTHIAKTGSDVLHELFEILPRLQSGVVVHFHDMFYPFEYPREWVLGRNYSWNELYLVRAFLTGNRDWEIVFFNDYFARFERGRVARDAPDMLANPGGGLWLRRR